jgi:MFS family permease
VDRGGGASRTELSQEALPVAVDGVLSSQGGRHSVSYRLPIPYFGFLWAPLVSRRAREIERAADEGRPLPHWTPWWAPPVPLGAKASATLASACLISLLWSYGGGTGGLLTQTLPYAADIYGVSDHWLGIGLAVVRGGVALALVLGVMIDRRGRKSFMVRGVVAHCVLVALIGLMPSFATYIAAQVLLRCLDTGLSVALAVLAVEEVPAGSRAVALSLIGLAAGGGIAMAVVALPLAGAGRAGFAFAYALQLLALPLMLSAARRLPESPRFLRHARERHDFRQLLRGRYARRLLLIGGVALLAATFAAPTVEFFNRYLDDQHGFSALEIVVFLAITGLPALPFLVIGGRLADLVGRRPVGAAFLTASSLGYAAFYLSSGFWLWPLALAGNAFGASAGAALAPYGPELFPTRIRSAAQTAVLTAAVTGSILGLVGVGLLASSLKVGEAIATLLPLPLIAVLIIVTRFPETAGRELEETSAEA